MLKLLTCARGHFWESREELTAQQPAPCPECGAPADSLPLLDLVPSDLASLPPILPIVPELFDETGHPIVAGFEIKEDMGRSPTGVRLYRARQVLVNRDVLLEVVAAREDSSQQAWGSLRGEATALGKLSHPNIVAVHEVGERDRQLFYNAVELVDGPTLAQKVADKPLPFAQVVRLMELLARAVDHAHQHGVLHRNLRPGSVLLQPVDVAKNSPLRDHPTGAVCQLHSGYFIPKLTGFGLSRRPVEGDAIDADLFGDDAGFLSPEQAWGRSKDLAAHTDVYGLGGILYFLLTGRPPFRGPSLTDILDAIQTAELIRPTAIRRAPSDLDAICRKCLTRQPRRRYGSAADLADDLARASANLPIRAYPASAAERLGRWLRRRPAAAMLLLVCFLSLIGMLVTYGIGASEAEGTNLQMTRLRNDASSARNEASWLRAEKASVGQVRDLIRASQKLDQAQREIARGDQGGARSTLEKVAGAERGFEWHYLMARTNGSGITTLADFRQDITALAFGGQGNKFVATAARGEVLRSGGQRGLVRLWHVPTRREVKTWATLPGPVHALAFSPEGLRLAAAGGDSVDSSGELRVFALEEGPQQYNEVLNKNVEGNRFTGVTYSGNHIVVAGSNGPMYLMHPSNPFPRPQPFGQNIGRGLAGAPFTRLEAAPDGAFAVSTDRGEVRPFLAGQTDQIPLEPAGGGDVDAFALGSGMVAVAYSDRSIRIQRLRREQGVRVEELSGLPQTVARLALSPDGRRLAAVFADNSVRIWGLVGTTPLELLRLDHGPGKLALAFSASGKTLLAAGPRKVVVWGEVGE
jgi:hypothetical protein